MKLSSWAVLSCGAVYYVVQRWLKALSLWAKMVGKLIKSLACKITPKKWPSNIESYIVFAAVDFKFLPMRVQFSQELALD